MADHPLAKIDQEKGNLISRHLIKGLPFDNKDPILPELFDLLIEPDAAKFSNRYQDIVSKDNTGQYKNAANSIVKTREQLDKGYTTAKDPQAFLEEALNANLSAKGGNPPPVDQPKTTPPPSKKGQIPGFLEPLRRIGATVLGTQDNPTALGEIVWQAVNPRREQARAPWEAPPFLDVSQLGASKAMPPGAGKGVVEAAESLVSGLASPLNFALAGAGSALKHAPRAQRAISGLFAADIASKIPEKTRQLDAAIKSGDEQAAAKAVTELAGDMAMAGYAAGHAAGKGSAKPKKGTGSSEVRPTEPPPVIEPPPVVQPSPKFESVKPIETVDGKYVVDPITKYRVELDTAKGEKAFERDGRLYIAQPTLVPTSFNVYEFDGKNRTNRQRLKGGSPEEAIASIVKATDAKKSAVGGPNIGTGTQLSTSATDAEKRAYGVGKRPVISTAPPEHTAAPEVKATEAEVGATQQPPVEVKPSEPAVTQQEKQAPTSQTPNSSVVTYKEEAKANIEFQSESDKAKFENVNQYNIQSGKGVEAPKEVREEFERISKEYADQYKVSIEEAKKTLQAWARSVYYGAKGQTKPESTTNVKAKPIPQPKQKTSAPPTESPKKEEIPNTTTKSVAESEPATASQKESLAATQVTPAPPVVKAVPTQEQEFELSNKEIEPKAEVTSPLTAEATVMPATEAPPAIVEIQPTTRGKYTHRFQGGSTLSFAEPSDLAIAMANPTKQSLSKHAKKLSIITVDGKPILSNPDLAMNLMVSYKKHLLTLPKGNAPTIAEYAERSWPDKGRVAISWPSESSKASEGYSPTTGTLSAREALDRVKFLRSMISTYESILSNNLPTRDQLSEIRDVKNNRTLSNKEAESVASIESALERDPLSFSRKPPTSLIRRLRKRELFRERDLENYQAELDSILKSPAGKNALELESLILSEEAAQQQRIKEARESMIARGGPRPVPVIESEAVKPAEGTPAAKLQEQIETGAMPQIEVPTVSNMTELRNKLISAESYIKDKESVLNIRDTRSTLLKSKIRSLKIELQGAKDYIRDIAKEESKSGKAVSAEEALKRSGKESAELYAAKRKAESIENELNSKKQELQSYEDNQVAKAEQEVVAHLEKLKALREQYESVKSKIDKVVEPKEKVKIEERANKSLSEIFNLEAEVNKLRDKFMEGKSNKQSSKTGKAAEKPANEKASQDLIDSTYNEAVAYAKDKGDLSMMDVLNEFKDYGLSNREIRDIYKKLKTDGVLDEKGIYIQKKTETKPTQAVKPEAKPEAKKPKTEEAEKPAAEVVEPPSKAPAGKFSDPADAEMYGIWKKNPNKFGIASPEDASKVAMYRDRLNFKNKAEGNRKIQKYMEYVEEQVNANKQIKSISSWLKEK